MDLLLELAEEHGADLAIANDPDGDRLALAVPAPRGGTTAWRVLTGDEIGLLLADHLLRHGDGADRLLVTTVVSSSALAALADVHGVTFVETLTGFKWLARAAMDRPELRPVLGYEEALGYSVGSLVRDKDGISAAVLFCDLVGVLKEQGRTVPEILDNLALRHGAHVTAAVGRPVADAEEAAGVMARLRGTPPDRLAGHEVTVTDLSTATEPMRSNALILTGGDADTSVRMVVRPSGTEPKVKFYIEVRRSCTGDVGRARAEAQRLRNELMALAQQW